MGSRLSYLLAFENQQKKSALRFGIGSLNALALELA
jgi:hypothetical protein